MEAVTIIIPTQLKVMVGMDILNVIQSLENLLFYIFLPILIDDYLGAYPGYSGYNMHPGYNSYPYNSYYNSRFGAYPYNRPGYGYHSYPSSYYSSSYANSVVGGGLGALGTPGYIPPPPAGGYHYNPGITGTVY